MLLILITCACRLTLGLRLSRTWQALKARCAALLHVPLLWYAAALQVIFRPGRGGSLHGARSAEGGGLLPGGGISDASVAAQDGSGIVHDLAEADDDATASTAESTPVAAALGVPHLYDSAGLWDDAGHVKYE